MSDQTRESDFTLSIVITFFMFSPVPLVKVVFLICDELQAIAI
ncbi:hypothetical protein [Atlanticothrix silvestris]|nr:hypothetical protein [Atlanticothrix silvestris]